MRLPHIMLWHSRRHSNKFSILPEALCDIKIAVPAALRFKKPVTVAWPPAVCRSNEDTVVLTQNRGSSWCHRQSISHLPWPQRTIGTSQDASKQAACFATIKCPTRHHRTKFLTSLLSDQHDEGIQLYDVDTPGVFWSVRKNKK